MKYTIVDTVAKYDQMMSVIGHSGKILGLDIETTALQPRNGRIRLIQISDGENIFVVDCFLVPLPQLSALFKLLSDPTVKLIIQNAKFEYQWFLYHAGIHLNSFFDTYLASVLDDFSARHNLAAIAKRYLGVDISKTEQTSDWSAATLTEAQYEYAATDVLYLHQLRDVLLLRLRDTSQLEAAKLEFGVVPAVASVEMNGMPINYDKYFKLVQLNKTLRDESGLQLLSFLQTRGGDREAPITAYQEDIFGNTVQVRSTADINIDSWQQVLPILQSMGYPITSTSEKFIAPLEKEYKGIELLLDYRGKQKLCSTYGDEFLAAIENGNTLYTGYNQFGTITARFSGQKPNLLTVPHGEEFRSCFEVQEGEAMHVSDYGQMELRILASYSKDPVMLDAYRTGKDLHTLTAAGVNKLSYDEVEAEKGGKYKDLRNAAKITNFSVVYGISPNALMLRQQGKGLEATEESSKELIDAFYKTYKRAGSWLFQREREILSDPTLRTVAGHLIKVVFDRNDQRSVSSAKRNARNYLIQAGNSCATKLALINLYKDIVDNNRSIKIRNVVHDEIVTTSSVEDSEESAFLVKKYMEDAGAFYFPNVKIVSETKSGTNWGIK